MSMRSIPPKGSIPPSVRGSHTGVRIGIGGTGISRRQSTSAPPIQTKPKSDKKGVSVLKKLLEGARIQEKKVTDMLGLIAPELPEYNDLLDRLEKLDQRILQLNRQIFARETQ